MEDDKSQAIDHPGIGNNLSTRTHYHSSGVESYDRESRSYALVGVRVVAWERGGGTLQRPRVWGSILLCIGAAFGLIEWLGPEGVINTATKTYTADITSRVEAEDLSGLLMKRVQRSQETEKFLGQRVDLDVDLDSSLVLDYSFEPENRENEWDSMFVMRTRNCPLVAGKTEVKHFLHGTEKSAEHEFDWSNPPPDAETFHLVGLYEVSEVMSGPGPNGDFCWVNLFARKAN